MEKVFRSNVLSLEHAIRQPEVQIGGLVVILDMAGLSFGHARFLSAHLSKRTVEVIQEAFPMRFKAFHILHEPFYMDAILAVLKPFLKEKIRKRVRKTLIIYLWIALIFDFLPQIHLHGRNLDSLHRFIPRDVLPSQYGGTRGAFDNSSWRREIYNDMEYFVRLEEFHQVSEDFVSSPGDLSLNENQIQFIDAETETDSEAGSNEFFNCDSTDATTDTYLEEDKIALKCNSILDNHAYQDVPGEKT